ncbi:S8 family serine peptidase [Streptomyces sp. NPDC047079]|uniref:S8 family serine peptidase n=1 Tax=Streptomyces sp. NPDC047079 TaxID=3154607 RepID=UPI0033E4D55D
MSILHSLVPRRGRRLLLGAGAVSTALVGALGAPAPSQATTAAQTTSPSTTSARPLPGHVEPLCGPPKPHEFACFGLRRTDVTRSKGLKATGQAPDGFGPADLRSAHGLPADGGAGRTIAVVDAFDNPNAEADLAVYRAQYGLPPCTTANGCFTKADQRGGTAYPDPDPGWAGEISLDLDMISAVAPNARILLVEADSAGIDDLGSAVDQAVALGAGYVSNSYGSNYLFYPEDPAEAASDVHYDHPGVAIVASSGDSRYGVAYPAASPHVTAVGGTTLTKAPEVPRGWSESVWSHDGGGTGSGCSLYEPKPAFQQDTGCPGRTVADVSAVADPATGVAVYDSYGDSGGWGVAGGTSASAPIITGAYANAGAPVAGTYPNVYAYASGGAGLHDVGLATGAYAAANGRLLVSGGFKRVGVNRVLTAEGYAYDPGSDTWARLPDAPTAVYRGGGAPGMYQVGGSRESRFPVPVATARQLPGWDETETDVDWLSENPGQLTLTPGRSASFTVTLDAHAMTRPGLRTASVIPLGDTPYWVPPIPVFLNVVKPPVR